MGANSYGFFMPAASSVVVRPGANEALGLRPRTRPLPRNNAKETVMNPNQNQPGPHKHPGQSGHEPERKQAHPAEKEREREREARPGRESEDEADWRPHR
jgi:hypothetical protein